MRKKRRKSAVRRSGAWGILILLGAGIALGWYLWTRVSTAPPQFHYLLIDVNKEIRKVLSGETLSLHPRDKIKILKISTNIPLNVGVRLVTRELDVDALRYEEMELGSLLPPEEKFDRHRFRVQVKYRTKEIGHVDWEVEPYAEDWLEKAERTIKPERRLALLERARKLLPDDQRIQRRLLDEYLTLKRWKEAAALLEKSVRKGKDGQGLHELLEVYKAMSDRKGVLSTLRRLLKDSPADLDLRVELAQSLENAGDLKGAIREYEIMLKGMGNEDRLPVYKRLGYLCTKTGQYKKAISYYSRAVEEDQKDANLYYNLSYLYEKIGKKEEADLQLSKAVRLKAEDLESRLRLARDYVEKGRFKEAEAYLSQVLRKRPDSLSALALLMKIKEQQGDKKNLEGVYKKILTLQPDNETVIYNLGVLEYESGNPKKSLPYFQKYLALHPQDPEVHGILFDLYRGQKEKDLAMKEARLLIKLRPKMLEPYTYLFEELNSRGDYEEIIGVMKKGLQNLPNSLELREYLLFAYLKTGKNGLAIRQMEKLLKARTKDVDMWLHYAKLLEKEGKSSRALMAYKKVLELSPGNEEAGEAYLRLRLQGVKSETAKP